MIRVDRRMWGGLLTWLMVSTMLVGCGALDDVATSTDTSPVVYGPDMYMSSIERQVVGFSPDPSGSLSLKSGDISWAAQAQALLADALTRRVPAAAEDLSGGAPGVPELVLLFMPIADHSGGWDGATGSFEVRVAGVPALAPEPLPDREDDVPGPHGKGAAWSQAEAKYRERVEAAATQAQAAARQVSGFRMKSEASDVYGSVNALAERLDALDSGAGGRLLILSDLLDTEATKVSVSFANFEVKAVQACSAKPADCAAARAAFVKFVTDSGGATPLILGHESVRSAIEDLVLEGGSR